MALYVLSFLVPTGDSNWQEATYGLSLFLMGPKCFAGGCAYFGVMWLANPLTWCSGLCLALGGEAHARKLAAVAMLLAVQAGFPVAIVGFMAPGLAVTYLLWLGSIACVSLATSGTRWPEARYPTERGDLRKQLLKDWDQREGPAATQYCPDESIRDHGFRTATAGDQGKSKGPAGSSPRAPGS